MTAEHVDALVVGGGQAGVAMSEHLGNCAVSHLVLERTVAIGTLGLAGCQRPGLA